MNALLSTALIAMPASSIADNTPDLWGDATPPPVTLTIDNNYPTDKAVRFVQLAPIFFFYDETELNYENQRALDAAFSYINNTKDVRRIIIEGHSDSRGTYGYNDKLASDRTEAVRDYLTVKGLDPNLMNTTGHGKRASQDINWTPLGRERNRKVDIFVVHLVD